MFGEKIMNLKKWKGLTAVALFRNPFFPRVTFS